MSLQNLYHKRLVAASNAKSCTICYKSTTTVLATPDSRDFLYVCPSHLQTTAFAKPVDRSPQPDDKKKEELDREIEAVKKEYEEKQRKRSEKKKKKGKKVEEKDGKKIKDDDDDFEGDERKEQDERDQKIKELEGKKAGESRADEGPRMFVLDRSIFQSRVNRLQQAQMAKRRQEQLRNPSFFPAVPKQDLG